MTIYFANHEPIDLATIQLMGVNVKPNSTSPIGYFGTGMKYGIATLLRLGCEIKLLCNGVEYRFALENIDVRGKGFKRVVMEEWYQNPVGKYHGTVESTPLGFTTDLGKNWEAWQAYREFACNAMDEGGEITDIAPNPSTFGTIFAISGPPIEDAYRNRDTIFLATKPLVADSSVEIHPANLRLPQYEHFYRGVRAAKFTERALFTYNMLTSCTLTEDRTMLYPSSIPSSAVRCVICCANEELIERIVMAPRGTLEYNFDFESSLSPSGAFMRVLSRNWMNSHCNRSAVRLWTNHAPMDAVYKEVPLDIFDKRLFAQAQQLLRRLDLEVSLSDFRVVSGLGEGTFAVVREGAILIDKRVFDMGHRFLASTIYEELLHRDQGLYDESRDMQNFLFEKLMSFVERTQLLEAELASKERLHD